MTNGGTATLPSPGSGQQQNLYGQVAPPAPPSADAYPPPPPDLGAGGGSAMGDGAGAGSGLDPKEVEAFYASQAEYGDGGAPAVDGERKVGLFLLALDVWEADGR